jgi:PAS domain-containing protein
MSRPDDRGPPGADRWLQAVVDRLPSTVSVKDDEPLLDVEETAPGADGRPRTRLSSKVPLRDGESGRRAVLSTTVDITARKELEHA